MANELQRQQASISFPTPLLSDLKAEARQRDMTLSELVRQYIRSARGFGGQQGALDLLREGGTNDHSDH